MTRDGTRITLVCHACSRTSIEIDDAHLPGGRTGWHAFQAEITRRCWAAVPRPGTPYPDYYCPSCAAPRATARAPQMDLFP